MKQLFTLVLFIILQHFLFAKEYIVSTMNQLYEAHNLSNPGDTISIRGGNYYLNNFTITRSGNETGGYITYRNYPGEHPVFIANATARWNVIMIRASYVRLIGLELQGINQYCTQAEGETNYKSYFSASKNWDGIGKTSCNGISIGEIGKTPRSHHVEIKNCIVRDNSGQGIGAAEADYITIEGNRVYNNCWYTIYGQSGINIIHSNDIDSVSDTKNFIRGNLVYGNKTLVPYVYAGGASATNWKYSDGNGIIIDVNQATTGRSEYKGWSEISNNISFNNGGAGINITNASNVNVFHNTCYQNAQHSGYPEFLNWNGKNLILKNNIFYSKKGGSINRLNGTISNVVFDYNIYYNGTVSRYGFNDIVEDPQFKDPAMKDFQLNPGSPAINTGVALEGTISVDYEGNLRPVGYAVDRGAYEYQIALPPPPPNLARNKPAVSSSNLNSTTLAHNVTDGSRSTRWASNNAGDSQWVYVDLGDTTVFTRVILRWEYSYANAYEVQTSNDTIHWTTIYETSTGDGGVDDLSLIGTARYVRIYGISKGTNPVYSLWEFEIYGDTLAPSAPTGLMTSSVTQTGFTLSWLPSNDNVGVIAYEVYVDSLLVGVTKDTTFMINSLSPETTYRVSVSAKDATGNRSAASTALYVTTDSYPIVNLALKVPAKASSSQNWLVGPSRANDGRTFTEWRSSFFQSILHPQWIYVDLGLEKSFQRIVLKWGYQYAKGYAVQVSNDAKKWITLYATTTGTGGIHDLAINGRARYVRIYATEARPHSIGYALKEFEVYGPAEPASPSPEGNNSITESAVSIVDSYPNPFTSRVTISIVAAESGRHVLLIKNIHGFTIFSTTMVLTRGEEQQIDVDLAHYQTGIYVIQLINSVDRSCTKKLVKE